MINLVELFCDIDDFCHQFVHKWEAQLLYDGTRKRRRSSKMCISERMTINISFYQSNHRNFKNFCIGLVQQYWAGYFPERLSHARFINTISSLIVPMCTYFQTVKGQPTGIVFVDWTSLFLEKKYLQRQVSTEQGQWVGFRF